MRACWPSRFWPAPTAIWRKNYWLIAPLKLPPFWPRTDRTLPVRHKLRLLRAARILRRGGLIAHQTGTVPGVAAADRLDAVDSLCRFKQRGGPFLLLADSMRSALALTIHLPKDLRCTLRSAWPGPVTFVLPGAGTKTAGLPSACFGGRRVAGRSIAVRVDADPACRYLAKLAGGLLLSSSLNRRGGTIRQPDRRLHMRWHRHLAACLPDGNGLGQASSLLKWSGSKLLTLREASPAQN